MKNLNLLLLIFIVNLKCYSAIGITAPSLTINTCGAYPSSYTTLGNIVITEGVVDDIKMPGDDLPYNFTLTAPANFHFLAGTGTVSFSATGDITTCNITVTASTITISYQSSEGNATLNNVNRINETDIITISGIQVRAITAAASQTITKTNETEVITGFPNATIVANLTSTNGCSCTHSLRVTDTYGDGWNGGTVSVSVNGVNVLTNVSLAGLSGPEDFTFTASNSDVIRVYETAAGSFESEMRVEILDGGMTAIVVQQNPVTGTATTGGSTGAGNCPPPMSITAATVTQASSASVSRCEVNQQIVCLQITTTGATSPKSVTQIQTNFTGTAGVTALSGADIYYTGTSSTFASTTLFGSNASPSTSSYNINGSQVLTSGINYFWLVYDLNNSGSIGSSIDGLITQFSASGVTYNTGSTPAISTTDPAGNRSLVVCYAPGGIIGHSLWLRSNAGTNTTTNNTAVSSWASQAANPAVTLTQGTASFQPTFKDGSGTGVANRFNYNPFIYTDGTSNRLFTNGDFNLGNTTTGVSAYQVIAQDAGVVSMEWYHTSNGNIKLKGDGVLYINRFDGSNEANVKITPTTQQACVTDIRGACAGINAGRSNGTNIPATGNGWRIASQNGICIGSNLDNGEYMNGGMGEYIVFPSTLSVVDNLKVESYLAIKYGVTLGSSANVSNYTSSDATVVWAGTATYQNDIIGIGRDDVSTLNQKQSHNYDDTVRIYKGTLSATNTANGATFALDKSFVLIGENTGKLCATATSNTEIPAGLTNCALTSRLEREWRVTKTNFGESFNIDIKLSACAAPASVNISHLRFLVDDDGNFANGGTQCYYNGDGSGIVISYSNPVITVSNISNTHIANNTTKFITIASIDLATPLPIELIFFDAKLNDKQTVDLNWQTNSERNNDYFTIDKSTDGINWEFLGTVNGSGTTTIPQDYYLEDKNPSIGTNYYKLKQTDFDGSVNDEGIRTIELLPNSTFILSPNPAQNTVAIYGQDLNEFSIEIFNNLGEKVQLNTQSLNPSKAELNTQHLAAGIYYVSLTNYKLTKILKLVIEK